MKYFATHGIEAEANVISALTYLGLDADSTKAILEYLRHNQNLLASDEWVCAQIPYDEGTCYLCPPGLEYYINLRIASIVTAAFLADVFITKGAMSALLRLCGLSGISITKLSEERGEKCIVKESVIHRPKLGSSAILKRFKGECCNNDLSC